MKIAKKNFGKKSILICLVIACGMIFGACNPNIYRDDNKNSVINFKADCAFCNIIAGLDKDAIIIAENDEVMVIEKKPVRSSVNCLIIPKKHIASLKSIDGNNSFDATILSKMGLMAQWLSKNRLESPGDFTVKINNGATSAQTVFHLHMHFRSPQNWKK